jgi:hypothetical protein
MIKRSLLVLLLCVGLPLAMVLTLFGNFHQNPTTAAALANKSNLTSSILVSQEVSPNPIQPEQTAVITLHVSNTGSFALPAVITDVLPGQLIPTASTTWTTVISAGNTWSEQLAVLPTIGYEGPVLNQLLVSVPTSWAENHSYCTTCAEEDNINIPLYGDNVTHFRVKATHPAYAIVTDNCAADFSGCPVAKPATPSEVSCEVLWDDTVNVISVCTDSDWWQPNTMTVTVGNNSLEGHRLVWNKRIIDEASWPEVMVYYQDGNMRLKPHPPTGVADVCYGSSVIIGPAPTDPIRPFVDVQHIIVNPSDMTLDVTYLSGESAYLEFFVDRAKAEVEVWADYDTSNSFATFRSMYVAEDNTDAARVETAVGDYAFLDLVLPEWSTAWSALSGPYWFFYRASFSNHNTSAPDILVEALDGYQTQTHDLTVCVNQCSIFLPFITDPH